MLPGVVCRIAGALDDLDEKGLAGMADPGGDYPLRVPASGGTWEIPRDRLLPYLAAADRKLRAAGTGLNLLMCAGEFPVLAAPGPILYPGRVTPALVKGCLAGKALRVGILVPNEAQIPFAAAHWRKQGLEPVPALAEPGNARQIRSAIKGLGGKLDAVVLDCMGFGEDSFRAAAAVSGAPVFSALRVTLCAAALFLGRFHIKNVKTP